MHRCLHRECCFSKLSPYGWEPCDSGQWCIRSSKEPRLWSHESDGVKIQFYIYLIVYVLLILFKQTLIQDKEKNDQQTSMASSPKDRVTSTEMTDEHRESILSTQ